MLEEAYRHCLNSTGYTDQSWYRGENARRWGLLRVVLEAGYHIALSQEAHGRDAPLIQRLKGKHRARERKQKTRAESHKDNPRLTVKRSPARGATQKTERETGPDCARTKGSRKEASKPSSPNEPNMVNKPTEIFNSIRIRRWSTDSYREK